MTRKRTRFFVSILIFLLWKIYSQNSAKITDLSVNLLPEIQKLSSTDLLFRQFAQTVDYNERQFSAEKYENVEIQFYSYRPKKHEDLLSLHASTGIPYDTIATLNSLSSQTEKLEGRTIILPSAKGIFVTDSPETNFEILINRENQLFIGKNQFPCYNISGRLFYFLLGGRFTSTQRAFFLDSSIQLPLDKILITSGFGFRNSPVYGKWKFHKGIDLAAKEGSPVYACKNGRISLALKNDSVFGNYVIISHESGMTSVYAHLLQLNVAKGDLVRKGQLIGRVGQTGMATGPHLHFEIRMKGNATDPEEFLKVGTDN